MSTDQRGDVCVSFFTHNNASLQRIIAGLLLYPRFFGVSTGRQFAHTFRLYPGDSDVQEQGRGHCARVVKQLHDVGRVVELEVAVFEVIFQDAACTFVSGN